MDLNQEKETVEAIRQRVREQIIGYIATAFGLVAGLAWNEAIKSLIDTIYPTGKSGSLGAKFIYAIAITIVVVVISTYLLRFSQKKNK